MVFSRFIAALGFFAFLLSAASARAEDPRQRHTSPQKVISIQRLLLPDAIADRIEGSGIECRTFASFGFRHKIQIATLRLVVTDKVAVRAGVGLARITPQAIPVDAAGFAAAGGVAYTLWSRDGYAVELDAAAAHGRYATGALTDATMMVMFRGRAQH
jgi:hypothetical protein